MFRYIHDLDNKTKTKIQNRCADFRQVVILFDSVMLLINKALFLWTICCVFLFLLILKVSEITYWNWFITFIPMWFLDFTLLVTTILHMSGRLTQILGRYDLGSKFNRALTLSFILWKLAAEIALCLYLEGYMNGTSDKAHEVSTALVVWQTRPGDPPTRHGLLLAVFPLCTTMVICLLAACSQIVNNRMTAVWAFCANEQSSECNERQKQRKMEFSLEQCEAK
uniref:Uncharacterized protein n=1 Tax=Trichobilharzia regenti TaxID=157069 RepID=A0AA85JM25_TRIRE|nr:unnamed protein product [Trichobilharzia regenti]